MYRSIFENLPPWPVTIASYIIRLAAPSEATVRLTSYLSAPCDEERAGKWSRVRQVPKQGGLTARSTISEPGLRQGCDRGAIHRHCFLEAGHRHIQIAEQTVLQAVNPTMHVEFLAAFPGVPRDRRLANVHYLLDDV